MSISKRIALALLLLLVGLGDARAAEKSPKTSINTPSPDSSDIVDITPESWADPAQKSDTSTDVAPEPIHWSGKKMLWDRKNDVVELFDQAIVNRLGERLNADYIRLDLKHRLLSAKGNCHYLSHGVEVRSEELHFNLDSGAGTVINGQISNGKFLLVGERINRLSVTRFQTHRAEYTTCHDCPTSWSFAGEDVDMEIEGYAHMKNVHAKVKDAPVLWFPYLIIPIKTKRQTGFLFPKFGGSTADGFHYIQPFFWAISRSTDMTIAAGSYSRKRGARFEWEGRYALTHGNGYGRFFYNKDTYSFPSESQPQTISGVATPIFIQGVVPKAHRWAAILDQKHEMPWGISEKLRFVDVSDNKYPIDFEGDIAGRGEPALVSRAVLSQASPYQSTFIEARRHRNLLRFESFHQEDYLEFDPKTVQLYPRAEITTNNRFILGSPIAFGVSSGVSHFTRAAGPFDQDPDSSITTGFEPGVDPVREATRAYVTPTLYTTLRPFDVISVIPSVQYKNYFYNFHDSLPSLTRGYLLFQTDFTWQHERIYESPDDEDMPKTKHLIRPLFRYSAIPAVHEQKDHPFTRQVKFKEGYNFDNQDIVPTSVTPSLANYFVPEGHSFTYGATTQLIRKRRKGLTEPFKYERTVEVSAGQTIDFTQLSKPEDKRVPLSRAFVTKELSFDHVLWTTQYYFYPYLSRLLPAVAPRDRSPHELTTQSSFIFVRATRYQILEYERSLGFSYAFSKLSSKTNNLGSSLKFSVNDFFQPVYGMTYDFNSHKIFDALLTLNFQSPSRCWKLSAFIRKRIDKGGIDFDFKFAFNLTGDRFGSLDEF